MNDTVWLAAGNGGRDSRWICTIGGVRWRVFVRGRWTNEGIGGVVNEARSAFLNLPKWLWTKDGSEPAFTSWHAEHCKAKHSPHNQREPLVYFLEAVGLERVKIGWSDNHQTRIKNIQACSPAVLKLLCTEKGGRNREHFLHAMFAADRLHGEWFTFSDAIRNYIASNKTAEAT